MLNILIKYPTRSRPDVFRRTFNLYNSKASGKHKLSFIVSMDSDDTTMNNNGIRGFLSRYKDVSYHYGNNKSKIAACNANLNGANFDIMILASDDQIPEMNGYDNIIATKMLEHFPNIDGAVHFNDGHQASALNTLSIIGKKLYDQMGYIYHPDYLSLWSDNEFTITTKEAGKSVYDDRVIIRHKWTAVTGEDELHRRNQSLNDLDRLIFTERQRRGFPKESIIPFLPIESKQKRCSFI